MFHPSTKKFFLYGLAIAGLEKFITQGVLKGSCFLWVFTLLPGNDQSSPLPLIVVFHFSYV